MNVYEILAESGYFGILLALSTFMLGRAIAARWKHPLLNPLLISMALCIAFLLIFRIPYDTFASSAKRLTWFLTPVTVCLAVPLYKQFQVLKQNLAAVLVGVVCGCIAHTVTIVLIMAVMKADSLMTISLLPKSVTTAIALGVCDEIGGLQAITIIGINLAGIAGVVFGPWALELFHVTEPVAQGLAMGAAAHATGTSRAMEMGEVQGALGSVAIMVHGVLTAVVLPIAAPFIVNMMH